MMSMCVGENIRWIEEGKMSEFSCHFSEMPNIPDPRSVAVQVSAKRLRPGCVNAAGKLRLPLNNSTNKIHQTWPKPFSRALYVKLKHRTPKCRAAVKQVWIKENRAHLQK